MAKKQVKINNEQILYEPKVEKVYPICYSDWGRIKRMIQSLTYPNRIYGFLASASVGLCASALIAIIDICNRDNVAMWFKVTMLCIFFVSMILTIIFVMLDINIKDANKKGATDIIIEMEEIESKYNPPIIDAESNDSSTMLK